MQEVDDVPEALKQRFPTAFQVTPEAYLGVAAKAQKWVDMAISRNLFHSVRRPADIAAVYLQAWRMGLKSTYYCFVNPRMQVEPSTVRVNKALQRPKWVVQTEAEVVRDGAACSLDGKCESCQ